MCQNRCPTIAEIFRFLMESHDKTELQAYLHAFWPIYTTALLLLHSAAYMSTPFLVTRIPQETSAHKDKMGTDSTLLSYIELTRLHKFPLGSIVVFWPCGK